MPKTSYDLMQEAMELVERRLKFVSEKELSNLISQFEGRSFVTIIKSTGLGPRTKPVRDIAISRLSKFRIVESNRETNEFGSSFKFIKTMPISYNEENIFVRAPVQERDYMYGSGLGIHFEKRVSTIYEPPSRPGEIVNPNAKEISNADFLRLRRIAREKIESNFIEILDVLEGRSKINGFDPIEVERPAGVPDVPHLFLASGPLMKFIPMNSWFASERGCNTVYFLTPQSVKAIEDSMKESRDFNSRLTHTELDRYRTESSYCIEAMEELLKRYYYDVVDHQPRP